eukprot:TRINITY_DN2579_c0_g3_i1.p1 TRINITY_DN2579_c0_g3~~TRINITY_DN2579_c0_g3_i1.p1  ORF type:complete len:482 (+),score=38.01 TRINITY_DN2579_c0_g3_i1:61-1506(+)
MSITDNGAHILVFPFPAQGHMIPLLDLTHQLAARGLTITILVTPKNLPLLHPLLTQNPTIQTVVLPFPNTPSIPHGVENLKDLPPHAFIDMKRALGALYQPLLHWFQIHPSPPVAILSDFFLGWTHHLACQLGIPRVVFSPSAAHTLSVSNWCWRHVSDKEDPGDPNFQVTFKEIPNSPTYSWNHLSSMYRSYESGDPVWEFIKDGFLANMASWGIVFNSFDGLEGVFLEYVKEDLGNHNVWAVGPLVPPEGPTERGVSSSMPARDVLAWLDKWTECSVVYVCFGSQAVLTNRQIGELAAGLERSGVPFVWCVKEAVRGQVAGEYAVLPNGFEDRVAGRGLVIRGWAPQVSILNHPSVGVFLSHCGWNSVLEGLVGGVSFLAWPMGADQFMDARLLVEEIGIAVRVCEGEDAVPNSDELARILAESVGVAGSERRDRAIELSRATSDAIKEGGSSYRDLDGLVEALLGLGSNFKDKLVMAG